MTLKEKITHPLKRVPGGSSPLYRERTLYKRTTPSGYPFRKGYPEAVVLYIEREPYIRGPHLPGMSYVCHIYVIYMPYICRIYAIYMSYICHIYIIYMPYICHIYVLCMSYICHICHIYVIHVIYVIYMSYISYM